LFVHILEYVPVHFLTTLTTTAALMANTHRTLVTKSRTSCAVCRLNSKSIRCACASKSECAQALHVTIRDLAPGVRHERWSEAPTPHEHPHEPPNIPERRSSLSKHDVAELQHK
jgi:hypothetical protein